MNVTIKSKSLIQDYQTQSPRGNWPTEGLNLTPEMANVKTVIRSMKMYFQKNLVKL